LEDAAISAQRRQRRYQKQGGESLSIIAMALLSLNVRDEYVMAWVENHNRERRNSDCFSDEETAFAAPGQQLGDMQAGRLLTAKAIWNGKSVQVRTVKLGQPLRRTCATYRANETGHHKDD
jgi:hypothetical protein